MSAISTSERAARAHASLSRSSLRVALLTYRGNPRCGGQGVYTHHLGRALTELGHHVEVFSGQPYPKRADGVRLCKVPSLDLYREDDPFRTPTRREIATLIDLYEIVIMRLGGFPEPRTFGCRVREELRLRGDAFDIIHDNQSLSYSIRNLARDGWPVVASIHHPISVDRRVDLEHAPNLWRRASLRRWYGFSHMQDRVARELPRIVTVSESSRRDIAREIGVDVDRIGVVPVGVDFDCYRPLPEIERVPGRMMTTTSADVPLKGLIPLLEALAKVRTERPEAHLVVIGKLKESSPVQSVVDRLDLQQAVSFVSDASDIEVASRYAEASCAVVPSLYEGFSLPAIEAMACGVPLVATTGGALPEVVGADHDTAFLVAPNDPSALAAALLKVLGDPHLAARIGERGRSRVLSRFSWRQCAQATVEQYRIALEGFSRC